MLTASERERAMGFSTDSIAAPTLPETARCRLLGQTTDLNALRCIFNLALGHGQLSTLCIQ